MKPTIVAVPAPWSGRGHGRTQAVPSKHPAPMPIQAQSGAPSGPAIPIVAPPVYAPFSSQQVVQLKRIPAPGPHAAPGRRPVVPPACIVQAKSTFGPTLARDGMPAAHAGGVKDKLLQSSKNQNRTHTLPAAAGRVPATALRAALSVCVPGAQGTLPVRRSAVPMRGAVNVLQRSSPAVASTASSSGASPVVAITISGIPGKISENQRLFVPDSRDGVYVSDDMGSFDSPKFEKTSKALSHGGKNYLLYRPIAAQFFADCLHTAEEINAGTDLRRGAHRSVISGTREKFGVGDDENNRLARKHAMDASATPDAGEAYVIVDTNPRPTASAPYHAAGVVAADGNARLTLETFAGKTTATKRRESGTVNMYSTRPGSPQTFHASWVDQYFDGSDGKGGGVYTTVIEPK